MSQSDLIINYLPQTLTDDEFKSMFLSIGPLNSCKIVRDRATNYSYGFGFVDYKDPEHAVRAIETLNGLQLQNKKIKVAYSRKGEDVKGANLYIRNLPKTMNQNQLEDMFAEYGDVVNARVLIDQITGKGKGVGFVLFSHKQDAEEAMRLLNGKVPDGGSEALNVKFAEENVGKQRAQQFMAMQHAQNYSQGGGNWGGGYSNGNRFSGGGGGSFGGASGGFSGGSGGFSSGGGYTGGPMRQSRVNQRYNPMSGGYESGMSNAGGGQNNFILFVYNIGPDTDERALWQLFAPFGNILKVNVIKDHAKGQGKGYGFVTMTNFEEAQTAINALNGYRYYGKPLQVSFKN